MAVQRIKEGPGSDALSLMHAICIHKHRQVSFNCIDQSAQTHNKKEGQLREQ